MNDDHAIVVGINTYPGLSSLSGACVDAQEFTGWLQAPAGGQVPAINIHTLLTTDFHPPEPNGVEDVHPVEEDVNSLFRPLVRKGLMEGRVGRRLYIYLAGHGFSDPADMASAAIYAANAEFTFAPHVAGTAYANWFRKNGVFDEIVLIMDCCRTTTPMQSIRPPPLPNTGNPSMADRVRIFYAYGTRWGALANERPINGSTRGIFTTALLKAVQIAPPNKKGKVTGQILKNHIHSIFKKLAAGTEIAPPEIQMDSNRDIAFMEREDAPELMVRVTLVPYTGNEEILVSDGVGATVKQLACPDSLVSLVLEAGLYKVRVIGTNRSKLIEVVGNDVEITI